MKLGFIIVIVMFVLGELAHSSSYKTISGTYDMQIQIGETRFNDILEVTALPDGTLSGSVTVPGVFKAELAGTYYPLWLGQPLLAGVFNYCA